MGWFNFFCLLSLSVFLDSSKPPEEKHKSTTSGRVVLGTPMEGDPNPPAPRLLPGDTPKIQERFVDRQFESWPELVDPIGTLAVAPH